MHPRDSQKPRPDARSAAVRVTNRRTLVHGMRGLTIIELLIVLVVIGVLLSAGSVGLNAAQNSGIATDTANGLISDLQYARSESVKRNQTVRVCAARLDDDGIPENVCADNWSQVASVLVVDATGTLLRAPTPIRDRVEFLNVPFTMPLEFRPAGNVVGLPDNDNERVVFQVTERQIRCIEILPSGHSRVIPRSDPNGCIA